MRRQQLAPTAFAAILGFLASANAWAQADEPGLGAPPAPASARPAPASQPSVTPSAPSWTARATPAARALAQAEKRCVAGKRCAQWGVLVRLTFDPTHGPRALLLLGKLGDARAASVVAQAAAYASTQRARVAARLALAELARRPSSQGAVARLAAGADDDTVRAAASAALGALGSAGRAQAIRNARATGATPTAGGVRKGVHPSGPERARSGSRTRLAFGPTAHTRQQGEWGWTIVDLGYHQVDYGVTDWLEVGLSTVVPVGFVSFVAHVKMSRALSDNVQLALDLRGGMWAPYIGDTDQFRLGAYGGGPILTATFGRLTLNLSAPVYGVTVSRKNGFPEATEYDHMLLVAPNFGFSVRLSRSVSLFGEYHMLLSPTFDELNGRLGAALYGVRVKGKRMFGDLGFVIPVFPDTDQLLKYLPVGIPMLSMGYSW